MSYEIERLSAHSEADVLDALRASFAQPFDDAFFA